MSVSGDRAQGNWATNRHFRKISYIRRQTDLRVLAEIHTSTSEPGWRRRVSARKPPESVGSSATWSSEYIVQQVVKVDLDLDMNLDQANAHNAVPLFVSAVSSILSHQSVRRAVESWSDLTALGGGY